MTVKNASISPEANKRALPQGIQVAPAPVTTFSERRRKRPGKHTNSMKKQKIDNKEFAAFMESMGLRTNEGAKVAADAINRSVASVHAYYKRGIDSNTFAILKIKLREKIAKK